MLLIILKIILCSSLFMTVYYLFLGKEKIYIFNRFYLLGSLVLSYLIPFMTFRLPSREIVENPRLILEETTQQIGSIQAEQAEFNRVYVLGTIYVSVSLFLLIRSILAFITIRRIRGKKLIYQNYQVIITKKNFSPLSFWNTIYMGQNYVKNNAIDPRIFIHEKSHLDQKHSIDVMLIEFFTIFTWFNPVLFLFKKAVLNNHEFLADEAVLTHRFNLKEYQSLILDEIISRQNLHLTHSFNFTNTKKRLIMMNTKKSRFSLLRKTAGITVILTSIALFSEKTYAGEVITVKTKLFSDDKNSDIPKISGTRPIENPVLSNDEQQEVFRKNPAALSELKKEKTGTISDTIAPKTKSKEGENTETSANSISTQNLTQAEYPDGIKALRQKIGQNMDLSEMTSLKGTITSMAYIQIDENGKATHITASGDNEVFNKEFIKTMTSISNETNWKPATQNGKAIASVLKIPAKMSFVP
ncbi:M56 family metallopeptidase [Chryseobacterium sp.]|uniref:M56 family metallopeptidase n=1 Tax=Chryseobacterium sp. TaxID=1871047 RepID=UPI0025C2B153|nr:M56 family metallopeptidase [Chryseobacterium sp.]MBV8326006.1 M56 family metallopeptidase [Chryseobacterium sp.]